MARGARLSRCCQCVCVRGCLRSWHATDAGQTLPVILVFISAVHTNLVRPVALRIGDREPKYVATPEDELQQRGQHARPPRQRGAPKRVQCWVQPPRRQTLGLGLRVSQNPYCPRAEIWNCARAPTFWESTPLECMECGWNGNFYEGQRDDDQRQRRFTPAPLELAYSSAACDSSLRRWAARLGRRPCSLNTPDPSVPA